MAKLEKLGRVIETDILIIGGGLSGLWAANRATDFVDNVLVVDRGPLDWGGLASRASGAMVAVLPGENVEDGVQDLVYYFDGLCEQDIIEKILNESFSRLEDYERLGHKFVREPDGKFKGRAQRSLENIKCYVYKPNGEGGKNMVRVIVEEADRRGVHRLGRILITDILKRNGAVAGAVGFNTMTGDFHIFKTGTVIFAAGNHSMDMVLRAGAELKNCEFALVRNDPKMFEWEGQGSLLLYGARFVNAKGEAFMDKYSPVFRENTDFHYNVLGMAIEAREGRAPFYLDCSAIKLEDVESMIPEAGWMQLNYKKLLETGIKIFEDKTEWVPTSRTTYLGVVVDKEGYTIIPGLFAAGTTWPTDAGVYMGGWNLCKTAVTGHIVGESAGKYARSYQHLGIDNNEVESLKNHLFIPLAKTGIYPEELLTKIQDTFIQYDVSILKNEISLKKALHKMENIRSELLPRMGAPDAHYLMRLIEVRGMALIIELYLRASLMRKESRAGHYREDYPERNNKDWLRWIIFREQEGELNVRTEPVPLERYKFKPTRYYMDNFKFTK